MGGRQTAKNVGPPDSATYADDSDRSVNVRTDTVCCPFQSILHPSSPPGISHSPTKLRQAGVVGECPGNPVHRMLPFGWA